MKLPVKISSSVGALSLKAKSASPQLLFVGGVVGVGVTVVLACRATLRVEDVINEHEFKAQVAKQSEHESKALTRVYADTSFELVKLYGPALICGVVSIGALAGSHNILVKRNAGLAAAYTALDKAYKEYRGRVQQEIGEKRELEVYNDVQVCEIDDPVTGKKVKAKLASGKGGGSDEYRRLFDHGNRNYEVLPETNIMFLKQQQTYFNQKLKAVGHVFLNDVLEELGFEHTKAGAVVGWWNDPETGDGYVDFGIFNRDYEDTFIDFAAGRESGLWLNFNVDGPIHNRLG